MATQADCVNAAVRAGATAHEAQGIVQQLFAEKKTMQAAGVGGDMERQLAQRVRDAAEAEHAALMQAQGQSIQPDAAGRPPNREAATLFENHMEFVLIPAPIATHAG